MNWKIIALFTPLAFVFFQAISKTLPKNISIFLINAYALLTGALLMLILHLITSDKKVLSMNGKYLGAAVAIGTLIALGNFGIIKAYSLGAPQSLFTIMFYVLLIIYGVIFGIIYWNERLHPVQILGLLLALTGIIITVYFRK